MNLSRRIALFFTALRELGPRQLAWYALYQTQLRSGYLRLRTPVLRPDAQPVAQRFAPPILLPEKAALSGLLDSAGLRHIFEEGELLVSGNVRLFDSWPVPLSLDWPANDRHWTAYEGAGLDAKRMLAAGLPEDVKLVWEPGRFGWAISLARAYHISRDERFASAFWRYALKFLDANPPNRGLHWVSAQEVALRLIAFAFAGQVFTPSEHSTPYRMQRLAQAIADHAARIPPSLDYARAQHNNHLLSEAAGLYTAGVYLPDHPQAERWQRLGWLEFERGLLDQVTPEGVYAQHSANYSRLVLHLSLWLRLLGLPRAQLFSAPVRQRLAALTRGMWDLLDLSSGQLPNFGPNDGAHLLPLANGGIEDYRPVLQAAGRAFLETDLLPPGPWDELALWLGLDTVGATATPAQPCCDRIAASIPAPPYQVLRQSDSWAYLRTARFTSRPGHADQLHLDLWWRGHNLALDPGTNLYNAAPPWDNPLAGTPFHNTIMVNSQDQMQRAGRFLFLRWAQARLLRRELLEDGELLEAEHDGYRHLGIFHRRLLVMRPCHWQVVDHLLPVPGRADTFSEARLHWLLPDWPWTLEGAVLRLRSPHGLVELRLNGPLRRIQLARAGELLSGAGEVHPAAGWFSPTYTKKVPALSFSVVASGALPLRLESHWLLPTQDIVHG